MKITISFRESMRMRSFHRININVPKWVNLPVLADAVKSIFYFTNSHHTLGFVSVKRNKKVIYPQGMAFNQFDHRRILLVGPNLDLEETVLSGFPIPHRKQRGIEYVRLLERILNIIIEAVRIKKSNSKPLKNPFSIRLINP